MQAFDRIEEPQARDLGTRTALAVAMLGTMVHLYLLYTRSRRSNDTSEQFERPIVAEAGKGKGGQTVWDSRPKRTRASRTKEAI